jgi:hypothetical protein
MVMLFRWRWPPAISDLEIQPGGFKVLPQIFLKEIEQALTALEHVGEAPGGPQSAA